LESETASLYTRWSDALDELEAQGSATDDVGLARAAAPHAAAFASRFATIVHHGAYDLIGVRVELVRALDRERELTFLLPADPVDASGAFGAGRARAIAGPHAERSRPRARAGGSPSRPGRARGAQELRVRGAGGGRAWDAAPRGRDRRAQLGSVLGGDGRASRRRRSALAHLVHPPAAP
jgi:hypothetical protein